MGGPQPRQPGVELGVLGENRLLQLAESRGGLDSELVDQAAACLPVEVQRLRLAAGPIEGQHQLAARPFAQGLPLEECLQLGHERTVTPLGEVRVDPVLERLEPQLFQPTRLRVPRSRLVDAGERLSAPKTESRTQDRGGPAGLPGGKCVSPLEREPFEPRRIDRLRVDPQHVAGGAGDEHRARCARHPVGLEHLPELRHEPVQRGRRRIRWSLSPELVDQPVARDDHVRTDEESSEKRPLAGSG